jgi:hypothetical protein
MKARFAVGLIGLVGGCSASAASEDLSPEQYVQEYFLDLHPGTAPLIGSVTFTSNEIDQCSPPSWDLLHPDDSSLDWPVIIPAVVDERGGDIHPLLPPIDASARVFWMPSSRFYEDLESGRGVMLATTWNGTEIPCLGGNLAPGAVVIRSAWFQDEPPESDVFAAASARVDEVGLIPLDDLDVGLPPFDDGDPLTP